MTDAESALRRVDAYDYDLPPERIARAPVDPPDASRLLRVGTPGAPDELVDLHFRDLGELLVPGDVLVVNETRVVRARLHGTLVPGGGAAELLVLAPAAGGRYDPAARLWHVLARPGRRLGIGRVVAFADPATGASLGVAEVMAVEDDGRRVVRFELAAPFEAFLERCGELPLPPYVGEERDAGGTDPRAARYQTTFARVPGSVAAPTASLHFTEALLGRIRDRGVTVAPLVLDVGVGTFRPIATPAIDDHVMHAESYAIPPATAALVDAAKREGRRVVAAGTTVLRALEASALAVTEAEPEAGAVVRAGPGTASLFITPGHRFRTADLLVTNFHLPRSSLLVLVAAFGGYDRARRAYDHAIRSGYRFYSFGDAMLLTRNPGDPDARS